MLDQQEIAKNHYINHNSLPIFQITAHMKLHIEAVHREYSHPTSSFIACVRQWPLKKCTCTSIFTNTNAPDIYLPSLATVCLFSFLPAKLGLYFLIRHQNVNLVSDLVFLEAWTKTIRKQIHRPTFTYACKSNRDPNALVNGIVNLAFSNITMCFLSFHKCLIQMRCRQKVRFVRSHLLEWQI